jgi:hypothetical protein
MNIELLIQRFRFASRETAMPLKSWILACAALMLFGTSGLSNAAPCAGFTDVDTSSSFCPNVEWLKNRQITLGCTSATLYCPGDAVSRLAMAAFLNRLGTALTPVELTPVSAAATPVTLTSQPVVCQTADYAVTNFPRRAYINGLAHLSAPTASVDVSARVVFSLNGGGVWTAIANTDQYASLYASQTPGSHATLLPFGWRDLSVGETVRFGIRLSRFDAGAGNVSAACSNFVQIANRNGASSPLDPAAGGTPSERANASPGT